MKVLLAQPAGEVAKTSRQKSRDVTPELEQSKAMRTELTIFTPTFNRAELLPRLFQSIKQQLMPGEPLEWLIIDDGSSDNTPALLAAFSAERPDLVQHKRVANGGKHRAINLAARLARGEWILIVDSDDLLAEGALEKIRRALASVRGDARIGMVRGLRRFPEAGRAVDPFRRAAEPGLPRPMDFDAVRVRHS